MEIDVLEQSKDRLKIEIVGEDHTLVNALRNELWKNSHVKVAGYGIDHSLISSPILTIETDGNENPRKALEKAVSSLKDQNKQFSDIIKGIK
ncbi:MAG TPA: DNA-directed RNA polymerase subunit L [Candidatus Nanoarchaeia archaeon]|nr:DNA-directed RNA polymerase subunit L [Candidatus Nanoarchaeia archaeon]